MGSVSIALIDLKSDGCCLHINLPPSIEGRLILIGRAAWGGIESPVA